MVKWRSGEGREADRERRDGGVVFKGGQGAMAKRQGCGWVSEYRSVPIMSVKGVIALRSMGMWGMSFATADPPVEFGMCCYVKLWMCGDGVGVGCLLVCLYVSRYAC